MKKAYLPPVAVLAVMFAFTLWIGTSMKSDSLRWQAQLEQAELLASQENWPAAAETLSAGYRD